MFTTKEIVSRVTGNLNRPYDTILYERIKAEIFDEANKLIAQQIKKYGTDAIYTQEYVISLVTVDLSASSSYDITNVLRTEVRIPTPVRQKGVPFKYVGAVDRSYPFIYKEAHETALQVMLPYIGKSIIYTYTDGYIYIHNNLKLAKILVSAAHTLTYINPNETDSYGIAVTDDDIFPIPVDMIADIVEIVTKKHMNPIDGDDKIEDAHSDDR